MSDGKVNPFEAPRTEIPRPPNLVDTELKPKSLAVVAVKWAVICLISAAPSFVVAVSMTGGDNPVGASVGMLMAIFLFICAYTYAEMTPFFRRVMLDNRKKMAARITYGIRVGLSIIFPIGIYMDFLIGLVSVGMTSAVLGEGLPNGQSIGVVAWYFVTTIVDGLIMNLVVFGLMLIIFGICVLAMQRPEYVRPGATRNSED